MNYWHLLWVIPACMLFGVVVFICLCGWYVKVDYARQKKGWDNDDSWN